jgi:hypothetical protein
MPGCLAWLLAAMVLPFTAYYGAWAAAGLIVLAAAGVTAPGVWARRRLGRYMARRWSEFWACGAGNLWPFFTEAEYTQANGGCAERCAAPDRRGT